MNILDDIVAYKKKEVAEKKSLYPIKLLERSVHFEAPIVSLKKYLTDPAKSGIIAEVKKQSPAKGIINKHVSVEKISIGYMQAGASALSILTDKPFFGGSSDDLKTARQYNYCPILRKEFIIDEYQIIESRAIGADAILLIAAILSPGELTKLASLAAALQMEILVEIHHSDELQKLNVPVDVVGINNRDLQTFKTDIEHAISLIELLPQNIVKISESGISNPGMALKLKRAGFDGFLIGEQFMKHSRPEEACANFIQELKALSNEN
jgi:indole-3-glycerol phosphate synthase